MPRPKGEPGLRPPEAHSALHGVFPSVCLLYVCFLTPKSLLQPLILSALVVFRISQLLPAMLKTFPAFKSVTGS